MSDAPTGDPIFPDQPVVPAPEGHPAHEKRASDKDWVVVHRGGAGSKAHVEALEHKLRKSHINSRVEHDDEGRVVLEVAREDEDRAIAALGDENASGVGETAHQTREQRIEAEERAELHGPFAAIYSKWLLAILAVAVLGFLAFWWLGMVR